MVAQDKRPLKGEITYPYIQGDRVSERHSQEDAKHTSLQGGTLGILFFLLLQPESFIPNRVHQKYGLCRYSVGNYRTSPLAYCPPGRYLCVWVYPGTSPLRSDVHRLLMVVPSRHQSAMCSILSCKNQRKTITSYRCSEALWCLEGTTFSNQGQRPWSSRPSNKYLPGGQYARGLVL